LLITNLISKTPLEVPAGPLGTFKSITMLPVQSELTM